MTRRQPTGHRARPLHLAALVGIAGAITLLGAAERLEAQSGSGSFSGHNSNAPVDYAADRIELQGRQDRVVLIGNVDIKQDRLRLRAARTTVAFTDNGSLKIERITASGGVVVTRQDEVARGDVAVYDFNRRIITMVGNASLKRGNDTLYGKRFVIDLNSGVSTADGRVSGTFSVPARN